MIAHQAAHAPTTPIHFEILHRHGIWTVTKNSAFFGDFTREQFALEAIHVATEDITASGGTAHVLAKVS